MLSLVVYLLNVVLSYNLPFICGSTDGILIVLYRRVYVLFLIIWLLRCTFELVYIFSLDDASTIIFIYILLISNHRHWTIFCYICFTRFLLINHWLYLCFTQFLFVICSQYVSNLVHSTGSLIEHLFDSF